jgi:hypothetical protein
MQSASRASDHIVTFNEPILNPYAAVSDAAAALLCQRVSFIEGVRALAALRFSLAALEADPDMLVFTGIDSETDHIPGEQMRSLCSTNWLQQADAEISAAESAYGSQARSACERLMAKFAPR